MNKIKKAATMSIKVPPMDTPRQEENTAKLVMSTFYKLTQINQTNGTTAEHIARYLREKFGDVFRTSALICKAEQTLSRSAALGFLDRNGKRYAVSLARGACVFRRKKRRRGGCRCRKRRRRRRSRCRKRRKRRGCGCGS